MPVTNALKSVTTKTGVELTTNYCRKCLSKRFIIYNNKGINSF